MLAAVRCLRVILVAALVMGGGAAPAAAAAGPSPSPQPAGATGETAAELVATLDSQLADVRAQVDELRAEVARAIEAYDGARVRLQQSGAAAAVATEAFDEARSRLRSAEDALADYAAAVYRAGGPMAPVGTLFDPRGVQSFANRLDLVARVGAEEAKLVAQLRAAQAAAAVAEVAAQASVRTQQTVLAQVSAARDAVQARLDAQQTRLDELDARRDALLAALAAARGSSVAGELARQDRLAAAAALAGTPHRWLVFDDATPTPAAARAIAYAQAQLGKPYEWAADGPDSFDCSGLTMRAWAAGGVSLPHYSVAQWQRSHAVPLDELRPGDLVFFADDRRDPSTIYHVGLYVGRGLMIEAPYTGAVVRVSSILRPSLLGAARP